MNCSKITMRAARVNAGYTQAEAAVLIGVSAATIQNWENGDTIPAWDKVIVIERVYKWPADSIIILRKSLAALNEKDAEPAS